MEGHFSRRDAKKVSQKSRTGIITICRAGSSVNLWVGKSLNEGTFSVPRIERIRMTTELQFAANRQNALKLTGPTSPPSV